MFLCSVMAAAMIVAGKSTVAGKIDDEAVVRSAGRNIFDEKSRSCGIACVVHFGMNRCRVSSSTGSFKLCAGTRSSSRIGRRGESASGDRPPCRHEEQRQSYQSKLEVGTQELQWCLRVETGDDWKIDARRYETLWSLFAEHVFTEFMSCDKWFFLQSSHISKFCGRRSEVESLCAEVWALSVPLSRCT